MINVISCVGEKNGKIKIVSSFSAIKLYFVIRNVLNNKTIILLTVAENPDLLYSARFRRITTKKPTGSISQQFGCLTHNDLGVSIQGEWADVACRY